MPAPYPPHLGCSPDQEPQLQRVEKAKASKEKEQGVPGGPLGWALILGTFSELLAKLRMNRNHLGASDSQIRNLPSKRI